MAQAASSSSSSSRVVPGALPRGGSSSQIADRFPPLLGSSTHTPSPRPLSIQRSTPQTPGPSISNASVSSTSTPKVLVPQRKPPELSSAAFPELPSSTNARIKPLVRGNQSSSIRGGSVPANSAWKTNDGHPTAVDTAPGPLSDQVQELAHSEGVGSKGKKVKGKQKQTLFVLGAFPT